MTDLAKSVMTRVARFEGKKIWRWRVGFLLVIGTLVVVAGWLAFRSWQVVTERGTLDLLTIFAEDREIVAEFWQDNLTIFWEELPHRRLVTVAVLVIVVGLIFVATKRTRQILRKKLGQLQKFS